MARLLFEKQGIRTRAGPLATGTEFVVYTDSAGTVLADISATSGGSAIAGSTVTVADIAGLGPSALKFYGPPAGTDTLYLRCPADLTLGVQEIEADEDERLDALEAAGGGAHPNLATHDAMGLAVDTTNTFTGIQDFDAAARFKTAPFIDATHPDYGATGDGTTPDHVAIQAAIDACAAAGSGTSGGGVVYLPKGTYIINAQLKVKNFVRLVGVSERATIIKAGGAFPTSTPLIRLGDGTGICFGVRVEDLQVHCNGVAGSTGVYSNEAQELSGVFRAIINEFRSVGIDFQTGASIVSVEDVDTFSAPVSGAAAGVRFDGVAGQNVIRNVSAGASSPAVVADAVYVEDTDVVVDNIHGENCTDLLDIRSSSGSIRNLYGHSSVGTVLHANVHSVVAFALWAAGATNLLVDDFGGLTVAGADTSLRFWCPVQAYFGKVLIRSGAGSPEGVMDAPPGSLWPRTDGGAVQQLYLKRTGTGTTGWVPVGQALYSSGPIRRSSGDATLNSVTWADVDNGLDIVLTALDGDKIEVGVSATWNNEAVNGFLDVATIVSAAPVTYVSSGTGTPAAPGITGWAGFASTFPTFGPSVQLPLAAGDVSGGQVRLRLRYKTASATNKILKADTNFPFMWSAKNLGPG